MSSRSELARQLAAWHLTIFLQAVVAAESALFSQDYGKFNALQQSRLDQKEIGAEGGGDNDVKHVRFDRRDFSIDDFRTLRQLWPPCFSVRRAVLTVISESAEPALIRFFNVRHKRNTPFPSENIALVMLTWG